MKNCIKNELCVISIFNFYFRQEKRKTGMETQCYCIIVQNSKDIFECIIVSIAM